MTRYADLGNLQMTRFGGLGSPGNSPAIRRQFAGNSARTRFEHFGRWEIEFFLRFSIWEDKFQVRVASLQVLPPSV